MFRYCRTAASGRCGILLAACLFTIAGCAAYPRLKLSEIAAGGLPVMVRGVPFYPQTENQCGPAALAGVLGATGISISPKTLSQQVYLPARKGSLQVELLAATRRAGLIPYVLEGQPRMLVAELEAGRPVLVFQNLRSRLFPVWHYAVLVGVDPDKNQMYLNSGTQEGTTMGARSFLRTWDWGNRWAMVALRPGELPATGDPLHYAEAVATFEEVAGVGAAMPAWQAAALEWPQDSRTYLALGNAAYSQGNLKSAVRHYRDGLAANGSEPGLNNNLASVLGELGCPRAGEALLQTALAALPPDSIWLPVLETTRSELAAQPGMDPAGCTAFTR